MSILLINAPLTLEPSYMRPGYDRRVPLGILYLQAYLLEKGIEASFYDAEAQGAGISGVLEAVRKRRPQFVGLNCHSVNRFAVYEIARAIKISNPKIRLIMGGVHPTLDPKGTLEECEAIEAVVIGEGEITLYEFLQQPNRVGQIAGIAYRVNGQVKLNNPRARVRELDLLPYPDPAFVEKELYFFNEDPIYSGVYRRAYLSATRGCPCRCSFCSSPVLWGRRMTYRSSGNVLEEIDRYTADVHVGQFYFYDDVLTIWPDFEVFCHQVSRRKVRWSCSSRINLMELNTLKLMAHGGCNEVSFGIESGSPRILDLIDKELANWLEPERLEGVIRDCIRLGIVPRAHFILGFPWESRSDIESSVGLALQMRDAGMEDVNFFQAKAYPGTRLIQEAHRLRTISEKNSQDLDHYLLAWDWFDEDQPKVARKLRRFNDMSLISLNPHLSSLDVRRLTRNAYNLFFNRSSQQDIAEQLWQGVVWHDESKSWTKSTIAL